MQIASQCLPFIRKFCSVCLHCNHYSVILYVSDLSFESKSASHIHRLLKIYICNVLHKHIVFGVLTSSDPSNLNHFADEISTKNFTVNISLLSMHNLTIRYHSVSDGICL
jgi:hypothetical protein